MKHKFFSSLSACCVALCAALGAYAGDSPFDPNDSDFEKWAPVLVDDDVMPNADEAALFDSRLDAAFGGQSAAIKAKEAVVIYVERQDYSRLRFNETCVANKFEFPNDVLFQKGLGTHACSRLRFVFPAPVVSFEAKVGIDRLNTPGSARYYVEANGKTVLKTDVLKGGDEPVEVDVKFDKPVSEFVLATDNGDDGPSNDQANWLEPIAKTADGKTFDLVDDAIVSRLPSEPPFSFKYDGVSSREFLKDWTFKAEKNDAGTVYSWTDPKTKLTVSAVVRKFDRFAAADWILNFKNEGAENSGLIEDVQVLDAGFHYGFEHTELAIHTLSGDSCNESSWRPIIRSVKPGETASFAPNGGRSSNGAFPFWNVTSRVYDDNEATEGLFVALGWSGQWKASFENVDDAVSMTNVRAGMEQISTILYPNEEIRSPRVLIMPWRTDRLTAQTRFRRLIRFEYAPRVENDKHVKMEFIAQCFDRYYRKRAGWEKCDAQIESARRLKAIGGTAYWFDAAWFPIGFPDGVGNWYSDKENFPNGVEELGDALENMDLNFILWFEPERVAPNTEIATKYPQYVFGGEKGGLYKLNEPEAREWLTNRLLDCIKRFKLTVYRNDFNIDPLPYWRANDEPNRQGITEIRYVEGHYEMWNRFRKEIPGLWIDNCASGGRRIDLETVAISIPMWRSDTCCWAGHPEWDQNMTIGLAQYLPLYSCSSWDSKPYTFRSAANPGAIMQYNFLDPDYDPEQAKASVDEAKTYQKFWYGDFYPLAWGALGKRDIVAWQLHRPDLDAGLVYVFRQAASPYPGVEFSLRAIKADANYRVCVKRDYKEGERFEISGKELAQYLILVKEKGAAIVVEYELVK